MDQVVLMERWLNLSDIHHQLPEIGERNHSQAALFSTVFAASRVAKKLHRLLSRVLSQRP
jgi:hypothetical protein